MMKLYKVLKDGQAKNGGSFDYTPYIKSKKWLPLIKDIKECSKGYHLTNDYSKWLNNGNQVWEVTVKKGVVKESDLNNNCKVVVSTFKFKQLVETNTGKDNTGLMNSGDNNSGNCNSGDNNSGDNNSGNCNSGNCNSGNCNSGDNNSGYCNSGDRNSGDNNSGNCNSGDNNSGDNNSGNWNSCDYETGCFNSKESKTIRVFNKKCSKSDWDKAIKPNFLYFDLTEWVNYTKEEMGNDKNKIAIGGYLKIYSYKEAFKKSFQNASKEDVILLLKLPNFSYEVFEEISSISKKDIQEKLKKVEKVK